MWVIRTLFYNAIIWFGCPGSRAHNYVNRIINTYLIRPNHTYLEGGFTSQYDTTIHPRVTQSPDKLWNVRWKCPGNRSLSRNRAITIVVCFCFVPKPILQLLKKRPSAVVSPVVSVPPARPCRRNNTPTITPPVFNYTSIKRKHAPQYDLPGPQWSQPTITGHEGFLSENYTPQS